jgi:hypothetical protein
MNTERIRRAANMGFIMLTEGVNFDVALASACYSCWIARDSQEFMDVRYRMARDLYDW